jgi:hypothetical protein
MRKFQTRKPDALHALELDSSGQRHNYVGDTLAKDHLQISFLISTFLAS